MTLITPSDRFAIFGARGMAGSAICRAFYKSNYKQQLTPSRQELDLRDLTSVRHWFSEHKPTVVVLAAAKVGGIHANASYPSDFLLDNLKIQNNVIETAWRSGVRRLLFLGSSCIYPKLAMQPIAEDALMTGSLEPTNEWYATAKIAGIKLCEALRLQHGFDAISLMPTNLYGPGDNYHPLNSHVFPAMMRRFYLARETGIPDVKCWGTGKPRREFMHVDDLASAVVFTLENWNPSKPGTPLDNDGNPLYILNVGTGSDITIKDLAYLIANSVGYKGSISWDTSKPDGTPRKLLNIDALKGLGWTPKISLQEGILECVTNLPKEIQCIQV